MFSVFCFELKLNSISILFRSIYVTIQYIFRWSYNINLNYQEKIICFIIKNRFILKFKSSLKILFIAIFSNIKHGPSIFFLFGPPFWAIIFRIHKYDSRSPSKKDYFTTGDVTPRANLLRVKPLLKLFVTTCDGCHLSLFRDACDMPL